MPYLSVLNNQESLSLIAVNNLMVKGHPLLKGPVYIFPSWEQLQALMEYCMNTSHALGAKQKDTI